MVNYKVLKGNVHLKKNDLHIYCDSALIFEDKQKVHAIGHIFIRKKDSIKLYCDTLIYDQKNEKATFKKNVRLIHKKLNLQTDMLIYDMKNDFTYYNNNAIIDHPDFSVKSIKGKYYPKQDKAIFIDQVLLSSPSLTLKTDTLSYYQKENDCDFSGKTLINKDSTEANCFEGYYHFDKKITVLNKKAYVTNPRFSIYADSIYLDDEKQIGEAFYNVIWEDTINDTKIYSQYAAYNKLRDSTIFYKDVLFLSYKNNDSLYLASDTLISEKQDSVLRFFYNVFVKSKSSLSECDSLIYLKDKDQFTLLDKPKIWLDSTLLKADTINFILKDKKIDKIYLDNNSWIINKLQNDLYNQIHGKFSYGQFKRDSLDWLKTIGNGESLYFAQNSKNELIGLNKAICDSIIIDFKNNKVRDVTFSGNPDAQFIPFKPESVSTYFLKGFSFTVSANQTINKLIINYLFNGNPN